jgi:hypothetical protein
MRIQANLGALRRTKPHEYAVRFAFGGAITAAAALMAKKFGPLVGGLFLAFPAIFPAGVTLLAKHQEQKKDRAGMQGTERGKLAAALDARGAALGGIGLMVFAGTVFLVLDSWPTAATLALATGLWFASSFGLWMLQRRI